MMYTSAPGTKGTRVGMLGLALMFVSSVAWADELPKYTGYTRPGVPTGAPGPIKIEGDGNEGTPLGVTVYFKVFERGGELDGDTWGTGFSDLERIFVPGDASRGRHAEKLDTTARYLYLYQVVNDSYRPAQVKSVAVRLLVPPHLITSWGHFAEKPEKGMARGAGFAMLFDNPDPKNADAKSRVLPLSTEHPGVDDNLYRNPAPYFYAPKPYSLAGIKLNNKPERLTDGEDTGREPERVVLQSEFNFTGAPNWLVKDRVHLPLSPYVRVAMPGSNLGSPYYNPASPLMPTGIGAMGMVSGVMNGAAGPVPASTDFLRRAPAVVAYWNDEPLRAGVAGMQPGQRSTLFGFTSNFPPVYEDVRVRGTPPAKQNAPAPVADSRLPGPLADGEVPTPIAFEQCIPPLGHALGSFGGPIGEIGSGGGLLRGGGGFGGGGFGFGFGGGGFGGGGGGFGGGSGGGSGGGTGGGTGNGSGTNSGTGNGNGNGTGNNNGTGTGQGSSVGNVNAALVGTVLGLLSNSLALNNQLLNALALNNNLLNQLSTGNIGQTVNVAVNVSQSQSQAQSQGQAQGQFQGQGQGQFQGQGHRGHHGHVVPEPAAIISGLLGLPCVLLLIWRRRQMAPSAL